jgi:hypothetical protein
MNKEKKNKTQYKNKVLDIIIIIIPLTKSKLSLRCEKSKICTLSTTTIRILMTERTIASIKYDS